MQTLNRRAAALCEKIIEAQEALRVEVTACPCGATLLNCGIGGAGGLAAGRAMAEVCLSGLGNVELTPSHEFAGSHVSVSVSTDHPVSACMASQYAGWQISVGTYFAMGSGPMRAAAGKEKLFDDIGRRELTDVAVGVLETNQLPPADACAKIALDCGVDTSRLYLLAAPTASVAGGLQVAARSVETALHKMHEIGFDLASVRSGYGSAPLPPVAASDLAAIGRTNDAVLYGGRVTLWVDCKVDVIEALGPKIPSCASSDFGRPFGEIFAAYDHDFYKIDPHLFSPATVVVNNLRSGKVFEFGEVRADVLKSSFAT